MFEEGADQFGMQPFQHQCRWSQLEPLCRELEQELEAVGVRVTSVRAGASMMAKMLAQKCLDVRCDEVHPRPPQRKVSPATAMSRSSSGVVSRYQYVASMLTCPM